MDSTTRRRRDARRERVINLLLIVVFLGIVASIIYVIIRSLVKWSVPGLG